jgi:hypothetical protein
MRLDYDDFSGRRKGDVAYRGTGQEPCAQRMPSELIWIKAQPRGVFLDDVRHGLIGQPPTYAAVPVDAAKDSAGLNAGNGSPLVRDAHVVGILPTWPSLA